MSDSTLPSFIEGLNRFCRHYFEPEWPTAGWWRGITIPLEHSAHMVEPESVLTP